MPWRTVLQVDLGAKVPLAAIAPVADWPVARVHDLLRRGFAWASGPLMMSAGARPSLRSLLTYVTPHCSSSLSGASARWPSSVLPTVPSSDP